MTYWLNDVIVIRFASLGYFCTEMQDFNTYKYHNTIFLRCTYEKA